MKNITNQSPKAASQDIKNIIGIIMVVALCVGNLKAQVTTIYPNSDTLISTGVLNKSNASNLFMTEVAGAEVPKAKFKKGKSVSMNGNIAISGTILGGQKVLLPGGKSAILREQQMDVTKRPTKMLLQGEQSLTTITNENFIFKDSIEVFNNNLNAINTLINSSNAGLVKMGYIRPGQSVKLINGQTAKISDTRLDFTKPFSIVTLSETQSLKSISNQNLNFNAGLIVLNTVGVLKGKIGYNQNVKMINGQMIIPVENFEVQFEPNGIREAILALDQNFTCPNTQILNFKSNSLLKINENNDLIGTLSASQNCKTIDNQNYLFTGTITCSSLGLVKGTVSAPQQVKAKHGEMVSLKDELLFDNIGCIKGKLGITSSLKTQFDKTLVFKANTSIEFTSLGVSKGTILFTTPSYQNALKSEAGYMVIPISSNEYFFGTTGVISGVFELYEVGNSNLYLGHPNTSVEIPYGGGQLKSRSSYPSNHMYLEFSKTNLSGVEFKINRTLNNSIINNVICSSITRFDANNKIIFTNLPNPQIFTTPVGQSFNFKNEIEFNEFGVFIGTLSGDVIWNGKRITDNTKITFIKEGNEFIISTPTRIIRSADPADATPALPDLNSLASLNNKVDFAYSFAPQNIILEIDPLTPTSFPNNQNYNLEFRMLKSNSNFNPDFTTPDVVNILHPILGNIKKKRVTVIETVTWGVKISGIDFNLSSNNSITNSLRGSANDNITFNNSNNRNLTKTTPVSTIIDVYQITSLNNSARFYVINEDSGLFKNKSFSINIDNQNRIIETSEQNNNN